MTVSFASALWCFQKNSVVKMSCIWQATMRSFSLLKAYTSFHEEFAFSKSWIWSKKQGFFSVYRIKLLSMWPQSTDNFSFLNYLSSGESLVICCQIRFSKMHLIWREIILHVIRTSIFFLRLYSYDCKWQSYLCTNWKIERSLKKRSLNWYLNMKIQKPKLYIYIYIYIYIYVCVCVCECVCVCVCSSIWLFHTRYICINSYWKL